MTLQHIWRALRGSEITSGTRRVGYGVSSKLFAAHNAARRREYSKYPHAVSIEKTERRKLQWQLERALKKSLA